MAKVALQGVTKFFANGVPAVRNLDLAVDDGEIVVLLGPSGCGKTTTLRLIAGLETPSSGTITIDGRTVNQVPSRQRNVAMVFQKFALLPHLTVERNLRFAAEMRLSFLQRLRRSWRPRNGVDPAFNDSGEPKRKANEVAKLLGLESLMRRRPFELSGGEQQRVALGRALVLRPAVFLLDEPLSDLDANLRADLRRQLHLLQQRIRATMIYVTHDQLEATSLADRIAVMDRGAIRQIGRPEDVYRRPVDVFVAGFVGWPPMNFLDGRLGANEDGRAVVQTRVGALPAPAETSRMAACFAESLHVIVGFRPEDVKIEAEPKLGMTGFRVVLVERTSQFRIITLERDGINVAGTTQDSGFRCEPGQLVRVSFTMDHAYFFDKSTGKALKMEKPFG